MTMRRAVPVLLILLFSGCIDLSTTIAFTNSQSGTIESVYKISRTVADLGTYDGDQPVMPLSLDETEIRNGLAEIPGLSLTSISRKELADAIEIRIVVAFSSLEALSAYFRRDSTSEMSLEQTDGKTTLTYRISSGNAEAPDAQTLEFVKALFPGYAVSVTVKTPNTVSAFSKEGERLPDGKGARFSAPIEAILESGEAIVWSVTW